MQNRNLLPFFWPKLVTPTVLIAALASGCAAGGGSGDVEASGDPTFTAPSATQTPTRPSAPAVANPSATPPAPSSSSSATAPVNNTAATNVPASNAGNEAVPTPGRDDDAAAAEDEQDTGANVPPAGSDDEADDDDDDSGGDDVDDDSGDDDDDSGDDDDSDDDDDSGGTGVTPPPDPGTPPPASDAITFTADIRPILLTECGRCHASGGLPQFASANAATGYDVAFRERNSIVSEIRGGNMPADTCNGSPGSNGCVSVADFNLIQQWVAAGAPE